MWKVFATMQEQRPAHRFKDRHLRSSSPDAREERASQAREALSNPQATRCIDLRSLWGRTPKGFATVYTRRSPNGQHLRICGVESLGNAGYPRTCCGVETSRRRLITKRRQRCNSLRNAFLFAKHTFSEAIQASSTTCPPEDAAQGGVCFQLL